MKKRITWVDYGKGFSMILVVLGHVLLGTVQSGEYGRNTILILRYFLEIVYAVHIPVFFALSGYFFKPVSTFKLFLQRIRKRLVSLGIPYVIFSVVMIFLKVIGSSQVRNQDSWNDLLNIWWKPIDYLWFLFALFFVDFIISLSSYFIKSKILTIIMLAFLFSFASVVNLHIPMLSYVCLWAPFFYLGYLLHEVRIPSRLAFISFIIYIVHVPIFCSLNPSQNYLFGFWRIVSIFAVIMMFYFFQNVNSFGSKFIVWVGSGSITIYLIHAPVISVIRILLFKIGIDLVFVQILLQFVFGFGCGILVYWLANKFKFIDFIFRPGRYLLK
ncbi:fucose 4-O-acetylase [Secundilactobacillus pentosiphilus]|uniref:Fucose 4-O-acetylase n=1 Tax=Secundilactobacillus pentosiphilus TaxID=1714682 RepID=A0A1Z5ISF0_9LACO|nr:acyltransferase family protein [Secundilactobacillus pentosiphilus]GAX04670.1 fucose 4-O-acetylase [Secundilactobacillus pentosiphilus]